VKREDGFDDQGYPPQIIRLANDAVAAVMGTIGRNAYRAFCATVDIPIFCMQATRTAAGGSGFADPLVVVGLIQNRRNVETVVNGNRNLTAQQ
jgi:hypothetical protein